MRSLAFVLSVFFGCLFAWTGASAQITVERTVTSNLGIPQNETLSSSLLWTNTGLSSITGTSVTVNFSGTDPNNPIVLGQYSSALRFEPGTARGITNSVFEMNGLTSLSQIFDLGSGFSSAVLGGTNRWVLFVTATQGGGAGKMDSWKLAVEGISTGSGTTMDLENGGIVRVANSEITGTIQATVDTGSAGNTATMEAGLHKTLEVTGGINGAGAFSKTGLGTVVLGGSTANTFSGNASVNAGTLRLNKTAGTAAISSTTIAVNSGGTLLLGAANQIEDTTRIDLAGGTLDTAGFGDAVGKLTVSAASTVKGLAAAGSGSEFSFSDIDLGSYLTSSGPTLTFLPTTGTYGSGTVIQLSSVAASSWTGYGDGTSLNNFAQKISFSDANLRAQINFGGGTSGTTLAVAAIPEPGIYAAAAVLTMLIGLSEYRRRRALPS